VQLSGFGLSGTDASNYLAPTTTLLTANITPAPLALTGLTANSKVYDTTATTTLAGNPSVTPLAGDSVSLIGSPIGTFVDKNVGTAKAVTVFNVGLAGVDNANYTLVTPPNLTANITPAPLQVNGLVASNKVYDATVAATLSGSASVTPLGNDIVAVSSTPVGVFADKNVGTGKSVSIGALSLTGADAGNYIPVAPVALSADITPATLTVTGVTANNKVYDATTTATLTGSPTVAAFGGDAVSLGGAVQAFFSDKNVGTAKSVAVGGYALSGADAGNYTLVQPSGLSATITPATLQITGVTAANKVYDGSVAATVSGSGAVAALGEDVVTVSGTPLANFASKDVGTAKSVLITGISLSGADAGNYQIGSAALTSTADITPAPLQVNGLVASNKVYDATVAATLSGSASVTPLGNDIVAVSSTPVGVFADKNVGTGKSVSIGALSLTGPDAGNYTPVAPVALSADITPATLTVTGVTASNKVYDATTIATLTGSPTVAAFGGDAVSLGGAVQAFFSDKNVGTAKSVGGRRLRAVRRRRRQLHPGPAERPECHHHAGDPADHRRDRREQGLRRERRRDGQRQRRRGSARRGRRDGQRHPARQLRQQGRRHRQERADHRHQPERCGRGQLPDRQRGADLDRRHHAGHAALRRRTGLAGRRPRTAALDRHGQRLRGRRDVTDRHHRDPRVHDDGHHRVDGRPVRDQWRRPGRFQLRLRAGRGQCDRADLEPERSRADRRQEEHRHRADAGAAADGAADPARRPGARRRGRPGAAAEDDGDHLDHRHADHRDHPDRDRAGSAHRLRARDPVGPVERRPGRHARRAGPVQEGIVRRRRRRPREELGAGRHAALPDSRRGARR
jgi:DMSO reductase anchor subunit